MMTDDDNDLLDEVRAAKPGDMMTIRHFGGAEKSVKFMGLYGRDLTKADLYFPLAGEYQALLPSGKVVGGKLKKHNTPWRVVEDDLLALLARRRREMEQKR